MRKEVEVLEHHADLAADLRDVLHVVRQLDFVDDDLALLVLLQPVDAADHGRLAGAGRSADDDALAAVDRQVDVLEDMELAIPLVHADRSEEHTSELQSLMRISYAVFCLKKKKHNEHTNTNKYTTQ